ncbi:MAG TPA: SGNH/GDSL hydrolase family protein, partial [Leptospiraceae bacterium]|nr:SGNH/GDSL hydrolase family protein [Leptospiraceae bacterium]
DSKKHDMPKEFRSQFLCYVGAICPTQRGVKYGILGDSWTDLALGVPLIESLRVQLEKNYNYKMVGSTLAGQTMATVYNTALYTKVIDDAGPDIKYMLLSLGGNDIQGNPSAYVGRFAAEKQARFNTVQNLLLNLIRSGNAYKVQKYGGAPMLWIIHGYDYPNPDVVSAPGSTGCRATLRSAGFTDTEINTLEVDVLSDYNNMLRDLTTREPQLRYIDLRRTLGGPPVAAAGNMWDCIHPNTGGFSLIAKRYVSVLEGYTNYEK